MRNSKSAFTLAELLVVIALLSLMVGLIWATLNTARTKGEDSKIVSEMNNIAKRATVDEAKNRNYHAVCGTGGYAQSPEIVEMITSIEDSSSGPVVCNGSEDAFALSVPLENDHWCINQLGVRKKIPNPLNPGQLACP